MLEHVLRILTTYHIFVNVANGVGTGPSWNNYPVSRCGMMSNFLIGSTNERVSSLN